MTPRAFVQSGESELVKGGVHCATGVLVAVMAAYNIVAYWHRRESHLRTNAILYSTLTVLEARKTIHHWS